MSTSALMYVDINDAKRELGIALSDDYRDQQILMLIQAASGMIKNHLGDKSVYQAARDDDDDVSFDSNFEPVLEEQAGDRRAFVRPEVRQATLMLVRTLEAKDDAAFGDGTHLPPGVKAILYPLRDPQLK